MSVTTTLTRSTRAIYRNTPAAAANIQLLASLLAVPTATPTKNPSTAVREETKLKRRATYHLSPVERRMAKSPTEREGGGEGEKRREGGRGRGREEERGREGERERRGE